MENGMAKVGLYLNVTENKTENGTVFSHQSTIAFLCFACSSALLLEFLFLAKGSDLVVRFCKDIESRSQTVVYVIIIIFGHALDLIEVEDCSVKEKHRKTIEDEYGYPSTS